MQFVFDDKINFLCDQETKVKYLDKNNKSKKELFYIIDLILMVKNIYF